MKMAQVIKMEVKDVIEALKEMQEDMTVPKNVKTKLSEVEGMLNSGEESSIKANKALDMLIEVSDDINIQPYVRTRIWNIVSMLEAL